MADMKLVADVDITDTNASLKLKKVSARSSGTGTTYSTGNSGKVLKTAGTNGAYWGDAIPINPSATEQANLTAWIVNT